MLGEGGWVDLRTETAELFLDCPNSKKMTVFLLQRRETVVQSEAVSKSKLSVSDLFDYYCLETVNLVISEAH
jgi:hypothetical protein